MRGIRKGRNQRGTGSERVKDQKGRIKEVREPERKDHAGSKGSERERSEMKGTREGRII